jgi:cysteine desulfuration protein SufE
MHQHVIVMSIEEKEKEILSEFSVFGNDWEARYEYLIDLGKELRPMDAADKTEDHLIKGCQSRVWLKAELQDGKVVFSADSDAIITKGMVALMVRVLSQQTPADIIKSELKFVKALGLTEHLSPTRANGLVSMIRRMKSEALRLSTGPIETQKNNDQR